jgi:hypothetical protein
MKDSLSKYLSLYNRLKVRMYVIKNNIIDSLYKRFYTDQLVIMDMEIEAMSGREKTIWLEQKRAELDSTYVVEEDADVAKYSV